MPQGILCKLTELQASPYYTHVKSLKPLVVGRDVVRAEAGPSGFTLHFSDGNWVLCALKENEWSWKTGSEDLRAGDRSLMHSGEYGDASGPLREDVPYAQEGCDFRAEVAKAIGRKITGISIGEKCFNFCFEGGRELDVTLRRDPSGKIAYRVFWEQW
jgi:hypothetical protein